MLYFLDNYYLLFLCLFLSTLFFLNNNKIARIFKIYDYPNKRKIHTRPVPITGGLGFFFILIIILTLSYLQKNSDFIFISTSIDFKIFSFGTLIFFIGIYDDKNGIGPLKKIVLTSTVYLFLVLSEDSLNVREIKLSWTNHTINLGIFSNFFTVFSLVIYLQIMNMFDGLNLQYSFYTIFLSLALLTVSQNYYLIIIIGYLLIFSLWNHNNKTFLGDGGNYLISFYISINLILAHNNNQIYADYIFFLLLIPAIDLIRLFIIRIKNKTSPLLADKNHIHHIILAKLNYSKTILIYLCFLFFMFLIFLYFLIILKIKKLDNKK